MFLKQFISGHERAICLTFVYDLKLLLYVSFSQMIDADEIDKYLAEIDKEKEEEAEKKKAKKSSS